MNLVLDASALLVLLLDERGSGTVHEHVERSAGAGESVATSVVNLAEVHQRLGVDHPVVILPGLLEVDRPTEDDAYRVADLRRTTRDAGLSLADRFCLVLAERLGAEALTADRAWSAVDVGVDVVQVR